jgi:hypothetical protein
MNQEPLFRSALIAGVLVGILSALPLINAVNCLCCAWVIAGGVLAAHLYVRSSPIAVTLGRGVVLGLLTGVIGAIVDTLFSIPLYLMMAGNVSFSEQLREALDQVPNMPRETKEAARTLLDQYGMTIVVLSGFFKLFIYGVIAMLGGAVGVALFEKRKPGGGPGYEGAYQPPPPPPPAAPPPPPPTPPQPPADSGSEP